MEAEKRLKDMQVLYYVLTVINFWVLLFRLIFIFCMSITIENVPIVIKSFILRSVKLWYTSQKNNDNGCLHHYVFSVETLSEIFKYLGINISRTGAGPYNWIIVEKKCRNSHNSVN